jgi:hypothetical protein
MTAQSAQSGKAGLQWLRNGAAIGLAAALLLFSACSQARISSVARIDLFSLEIGPLDNQINLTGLVDGLSVYRTSLAMRDGLFYIADTPGRKIVRYTSFGDLLFVIYNEAVNPPPITLRHGIEDEGMATRWSIAHPLLEPGSIAVDSRKHIYAADKTEDDKKAYDSENKTMLDSVIAHFDDSGRFVNYLGQEGIGGKPFPRITGLYATINDELAVVCLLPSGWDIYWFNAEGTLLYLVHLRKDSIPFPQGAHSFPAGTGSGENSETAIDDPQSGGLAEDALSEFLFSSVDSIAAAPDERRLFLKVDYYQGTSPAVPASSLVWIINVEDGTYEESIDVPFFEYTDTENNQKITQKLLYSMLGVIRDKRVFLYFPVDGGYSLLVLTAGSRERRLGFIQIRNDELEYNTFNLSPEGILSGMLATNWEARLVWWRTDRLLGEMNL